MMFTLVLMFHMLSKGQQDLLTIDALQIVRVKF